MGQSSRSFFFLISVVLSFVLAAVLVVLNYAAAVMQILFTPYQFFLIGICVGALATVTIALMAERSEWPAYRTYSAAVLISVFLLVVLNSVIFRVLGGGQFIRNLLRLFYVEF